MKWLVAILISVGWLSFSFGAPVWAEKVQPIPPAVTGSRFLKPVTGYNPDKLETIRGQVTEVRRNLPKNTKAPVTLQLVVQTEKETVAVQVGPASYVDPKITFAIGDRVEVSGSRLAGPRMVTIFAAEIRKGDKLLKLRNEMGNPLWGGGKGR